MEKDKSQRIQMVYGYAVCIVAVVTFLISLTAMVYAIIDLTDPVNAYRTYGRDVPSLASFDNYKVDIIKATDPAHELELDDATLKSMYEAAKNDAVAKVKHESIRSIMINNIVILICLILFMTHWMWMRRLSKKAV
jgi:hypothetical protein